MSAAPVDHILHELLPATTRVDDELHGTVAVTSPLWVPGTDVLRTSVLAMWADTVAGLLMVDLIAPRVPVTLELDVQVLGPLPSAGPVAIVARPIKTGRTINVLTVEFSDGSGRLFAIGGASFMAAPDPGLVMPTDRMTPRPAPARTTATGRPLAERVGCTRDRPGVVVISRLDATTNASNTLNGGLLGLAAEEAVLSMTPDVVLSSLALRYLRPVRVGPGVATAELHGLVGRVEVRDAGADDRLAVLATTTSTPTPGPTRSSAPSSAPRRR